MNRLIVIGGGALLLVLLVLAILGVRSCADDPDPDGVTANAGRARAEAQVGAASEAVAITTNTMADAAAIDATTRSNNDAIRSSEGARAPVPAAVGAAGLRALCVRAAYRDQPRCTALLRPGAGTVGR